MPNQLRNLDVSHVSLVDRAAVRDPSNPTEPQRFLLFKKESGSPTPTGGDMPNTPTAEELTTALAKAEEERDAAIERAEKAEELAKSTETEPKTEPKTEIDKSELPAEVRAILEKAETETAEIRKRAEAAEELAKAERDARIEREFITKAASDFPHLGNASDLGPRLKRMSETLSKEDYDAHLQELKAANARIETGQLFAELGKSGDPTPGSSDTSAELQAKAEEIRKADPNVSEYEAKRRALQADKETQARYLSNAR